MLRFNFCFLVRAVFVFIRNGCERRSPLENNLSLFVASNKQRNFSSLTVRQTNISTSPHTPISHVPPSSAMRPTPFFPSRPTCDQLRIQEGGAMPPPVPVKTSHKKDGRHRRPLIFHVSWPNPPAPPPWPSWIRYCVIPSPYTGQPIKKMTSGSRSSGKCNQAKTHLFLTTCQYLWLRSQGGGWSRDTVVRMFSDLSIRIEGPRVQ